MIDSHDSKFLDDPKFQSLLIACLESLQHGQTIDRDALAKDYPEYAVEIDQFLADRRLLEEVAAEFDEVEPSGIAISSYENTLDLSSERKAFAVGATIRYIGDHEILEEIARGGMGIVFKARQLTLGRIVALKMILAGRLADEADVERFHREAQAVGRLKHPNIVPIYEVGEYEGRHYFTMDFVAGSSLADAIRETPLAPRAAAKLVQRIARGVQYAHDSGTVHRDLKPANILLDENSNPQITDFGLAKVLKPTDGATQAELTATGQILGTPGYMAPEQASGKRDLVGPASDIYSLGAILYACLTGRAPFAADSPIDTLLQVMHKDPVAPSLLTPNVPKDLETICLKCLSKEPNKRYAAAQDLTDDLGRFLEGRPVSARPVGAPAKIQRWAKRNPWIAGFAALSAVLLIGGTAVSSYFAVMAERRANAEADQHRRADEQTKLAKEAQQKTAHALELEAEARAAAEHSRASSESALAAEEQAREFAEAARIQEAAARRLAEHATNQAQRQTYVARLQPIRQAWLEREYGHLDRLLQGVVPKETTPDFRGWEWDFFKAQVEAVAPRVGEDVNFQGQFLYDAPRRRMFAWVGNRLAIWDFQSNSLVKTLSLPPIRWNSLSISPDGKLLAAGDGKSNVFVWDTETDVQIHTMQAQEFDSSQTTELQAQSTVWSPDGSLLATASRRGELRIWNTNDWSLNKVLLKPSHRNTMGGMDWHPQAGLVTGHRYGWFRIWDVDSGKVLHTGRDGGSIIETTKWSPSGDKFAIVEEGLGIWSAQGKRIGEHLQIGFLPTVAWLDDEHLACGGDNQNVVICNAETATVDRTLRVHSGQVRSLARFDDHTILSGAVNDGIRLVKTDVVHPGITSVRAHTEYATEVEWSPDGTKLATSGKDGKASVRDASTLRELLSLEHEGTHPWIWDVAWNNAGDRLATIGHLGLLKMWDAVSGELIKQQRIKRLDHPRLDWRPSNRYLVFGGNRPQVVDASTLESVWTIDAKDASWRIEMQVSPDGQRAIGNSQNGSLFVVGLKPPELQKKFSSGDPGTGAGAWSPNGERFVAAGTDLSIYDANTFRRLARLEGHRGPIGGVCYHPNGSRIASAGSDGMIYLWDVASGDLLLRIPILDGAALTAIEWSPDGRRLATVDATGNLIVLGSEDFAREGTPDVPGEYALTPAEQLAKLALAIAESPSDSGRWRARAKWYAKHLRWAQSLEQYEQATRLNPQSNWYRSEAAAAALMAGNVEAYRRHLQASLEEVKKNDFSSGAGTGAYLAEVASLRPDAVQDFNLLLPLAQRRGKVELDKFWHAKPVAMVELRLGNYDHALELLGLHLNRGKNLHDQIVVDSVRALALQKLGRKQAAVAAFHKAERVAVEAWPEPAPGEVANYGDLGAYVQAKVLLREARALFNHQVEDSEQATEKSLPEAATQPLPTTATPTTVEYYQQLKNTAKERTPEESSPQKPSSEAPTPQQPPSKESASNAPSSDDVQSLIKQLDSKDDKQRLQALMSIAKAGPQAAGAVPKLLEMLRQEPSHETRFVVECLGQIGPAAKASVPELIDLVKSDKMVLFRIAAVGALAKIEPTGKTTVPALIGLLKNPGKSVKTYPSGGSPAALGLTTPLMHKGGYFDSRDDSIIIAIGGLGEFGAAAQEAIPEMERIRDDPEMLFTIRDGAREALDRIGQEIAKQQKDQQSSSPTDSSTSERSNE